MFRLPSGVFGMNWRNRMLVASLNPRKAIALANDKVACKEALDAHQVRTPRTIAALYSVGEIGFYYPQLKAQEEGFVVKPARGAQGRGVTLFTRALDDRVLPLHGKPMTPRAFEYLIATIISGEFTLGVPQDCALVEERLKPSTSWVVPDLPGSPDLRIIVWRGTPVMGMVRLPTIASRGRANLHKGGVGLGVDLPTGTTTHAIWKGKAVLHHPDTGGVLAGRAIEGWVEAVELARRCAEAVPLGYMGVDIMFDRDKGLCVLEVNARPGLAIQVANGKGVGVAFEEVAARAARDEEGISKHE